MENMLGKKYVLDLKLVGVKAPVEIVYEDDRMVGFLYLFANAYNNTETYYMKNNIEVIKEIL